MTDERIFKGEKEKYEIKVMHHPKGIFHGCIKCRKILRRGTWAIGLIIGPHNYVVGEDKKVMRLFTDESSARKGADEVLAILDRDGTTQNLILYEVFEQKSDAVH